jgi:hypothetical protein
VGLTSDTLFSDIKTADDVLAAIGLSRNGINIPLASPINTETFIKHVTANVKKAPFYVDGASEDDFI